MMAVLGGFLVGEPFLNAVCTLVFADLEGRLCLVDATINDQSFHLIGIYEPNGSRERAAFLRSIDPVLMTFLRVILVGDSNAVLDLGIEPTGTRLDTKKPGCKTISSLYR